MRRDAQARREALLEAAAERFSTSGYRVPLEEVAARAGVGRGTLYRNFPDRMALALAIFDRELDKLEARLDTSLPLDRAIMDLVIKGADASALFARLAIEMPLAGDHLTVFAQFGDRLVRILQPVVDRAHHDGALRPDAGARHVMLAMRMINGLVRPQMSEAELNETVAEALSLVMAGLQPR